MWKIILIKIILFFNLVSLFSDSSKQKFLDNIFQNFNDVVDTFVFDYSKISGFYTIGGEIKGAATIGSFPSFRCGASVGTIFFRNPINFLKKINFYGANWGTIHSSLESLGAGATIDWFDNYFLPLPVTSYHYDIGLPYGLVVGTRFNIAPLGSFINAVASNQVSGYSPQILLWGVGINLNYTILREHDKLPSISVGVGIQYSDTTIGFNNVSIGNIRLDESNDSIPTSLGFYTHNNNVSFYFDFSISKRINFFQPYFTARFIQTIDHNVTKFIIGLDLSRATDDAKNTYESTNVISNISSIDQFNNETGVIVPATDFILCLGFEFIMKIFRMGIEGTFSVVSQTGMVTLGMRFQVEDWQFDKFKKLYKKQ